MKKIWLLSSFILSMAAAPVFGQQSDESPKGTLFQRRHTCPADRKCTSCCKPSMHYRLPSDFTGLTAYAECLVWQVQQQASHFVITPNEDSTLDLNTPNTEGLGRIRSASFDWNPGVRVGLGYTTKRDFWETLAQYTWFSTSGSRTHSRSSEASPSDVLMSTFYSSPNTITSARNTVSFSYQMGDLLAKRSFLPTEQIKLCFSLGTTGGFIKEQSKITYESLNNTYVKNSWSFGGGGFRAGLDSNWHIGKGFGLFSRVSFAAILGHYANSERITTDGPAENPLTQAVVPFPNHLANSDFSGILLMPTTQFALGFDWTRSFTNCCISGVNLALATEFNNLANLQQVFKTTSAPTTPTIDKAPTFRDTSSVYMYGVNLRLGVDY